MYYKSNVFNRKVIVLVDLRHNTSYILLLSGYECTSQQTFSSDQPLKIFDTEARNCSFYGISTQILLLQFVAVFNVMKPTPCQVWHIFVTLLLAYVH